MLGYWNRPEATAEMIRNGWLHSGDIAVMDEDGYFLIVDRMKDMILVCGFNVYPTEVEDVLFHHPKISKCAVIGVPDDHDRRAGEGVRRPEGGRDRDRRRRSSPGAAIRTQGLTGYRVPQRDRVPRRAARRR